MAMLSRFWNDKGGNFAVIAAIASVPVLGGIALGVDYTEMTRQRAVAQAAVDASGLATAKRIAAGDDDAKVRAYALSFFKANLGKVDSSNVTMDVTLPDENTAAGTLKLTARLAYKPYLAANFAKMIGKTASASLPFTATTEIRLKNTIEVALVLDNSGSMEFLGKNSIKKRMDLLKDAAKELVDTMAAQANLMTQVAEPVRFSVVPFAGSVDVGTDYRNASWMDTTGISPMHHENFDWSGFGSASKWVEQVGNQRIARGTGWGALKDQPLTRFTLFDSLQRTVLGKTVPAAAWSGCVESRPYPYNVNDAAPSTGKPETLFVPMFAPDETDQKDGYGRPANNSWWADGASGNDNIFRQRNAAKYFTTASTSSFVTSTFLGNDVGPNFGCSTKPITPLTDVTTSAGKKLVKDAIDSMVSDGATNVPEGMAWGWRTVSSGAPFTQGRPETERGNDKVVIVLTDGANTYYTPDTVQANEYSGAGYIYGGNDLALNRSMYSAYGYVGTNGTSTRLFANTSGSVGKTTYSNANYSKALNEQFDSLCANSAFVKLSADKRTRTGQVVVMTIALDLDASDATEKAQLDELKACASPSKVTPGKTLFWNATGATLNIVFKDIANELSNLRIVG